YIAFSDDDSWWEPGALAEAERVLDDHPAVALVAGRTLVGADGAPDPVTDLMRDSALPRTHPMPGPPVLGFTACAAVVRRRAFAEAGGFSRLLFFVAEEKLLSYDLAAKGWDLCYVSSVVAHHHPSPHRPPSDWRRTLELRNNALIAWMRRPVRVALGEARELAAAARHDRVARRALLAAVRRLPSALLRRRRLPARVEDMIRLLEG
ncbi:glycosyl transferase, partial [Saccharopolyspora erythraea D]